MCQKSYVWICCFFVKNGEWWSCDLMNLEWFHEWLLLLMFEKHVVDELVCWVCYGWIDDECCCCEVSWVLLFSTGKLCCVGRSCLLFVCFLRSLRPITRADTGFSIELSKGLDLRLFASKRDRSYRYTITMLPSLLHVLHVSLDNRIISLLRSSICHVCA